MTTDFFARLPFGGVATHGTIGDRWHDFWQHGDIGLWVLTRGLKIALLLIGGLLGARFIKWAASRVSRRIDATFQESDALVRTESAKHSQALASVISYLAIALLTVMVVVQVTETLAIPVGSLVAPAAVLECGAGLRCPAPGSGPAQRVLHHHREAVRIRRYRSAHVGLEQ